MCGNILEKSALQTGNKNHSCKDHGEETKQDAVSKMFNGQEETHTFIHISVSGLSLQIYNLRKFS